MPAEVRTHAQSSVFGAMHPVVEREDYMDNSLTVQMGCGDDARKPYPASSDERPEQLFSCFAYSMS